MKQSNNPDHYTTVVLHESVVDILKEGRDATMPDQSVEDYIEHLAAMHKAVREKFNQEDISHDQKNHR